MVMDNNNPFHVVFYVILLWLGMTTATSADGYEVESVCKSSANHKCFEIEETDELQVNISDSPWSLQHPNLLNLRSIIDTEIRVVLVGRTGEGKTSTANSIVGRKHFAAKATATSVTKRCDFVREDVQGKTLMLVDTPGIFDTEVPNGETRLEISKSLIFSSPGPHVFLLVISIQRFTEEIITSVKLMRNTFGEDALKYTIIVFTRKDDLDNDNLSIEEFLEDIPDYMSDLLNACGRRYVAFNNKLILDGRENEAQVRRLLAIVDDLIAANDGGYYSYEAYDDIERNIVNEEKRRQDEIEKKRLEVVSPLLEHIEEYQRSEAELKEKIDQLNESHKQERQKLHDEYEHEKEKLRRGNHHSKEEHKRAKEEYEKLKKKIDEENKRQEQERQKFNEEYEEFKKKEEESKEKARQQNDRSKEEKEKARENMREEAKRVCVPCITAAGMVGSLTGSVAGAAFGPAGAAVGAGMGFILGSACGYVVQIFQ